MASVGWAVSGSKCQSSRKARYSGLARSAWATQMRGSRWISPRSCIMAKPCPSACTLPRLPPGITTQSGTLPVELLDDLDGDRLLALDAQAFIELAR